MRRIAALLSVVLTGAAGNPAQDIGAAPPVGESPPPVNLPGFVPAPNRPVEVIEGGDNGLIHWSEGYVRAKGYGVIDAGEKNRGLALKKAERAAVVVAQRNLLELVKGVRVDGETVVEDFMLKSDRVVTRVEGFVKGAKPVGKPLERDGIVEVTLQMPLWGKESVADGILEPPVKTLPIGKDLESRLEGISGIVIDARGSGSNPALLPKIYDDKGNLLLDLADVVDPNDPKLSRPIRYVTDVAALLNDPELRKNPIVIKVIGTIGEGKADLVISSRDAGKLRWLKTAGSWLWKLGKVVFTFL